MLKFKTEIIKDESRYLFWRVGARGRHPDAVIHRHFMAAGYGVYRRIQNRWDSVRVRRWNNKI